MTDHRYFRRTGAAALLTVVAAASSFFGTGAHAAAPGPYSGYAHATAVHVDGVTNGATRLANVDVGVTSAAVNSQGLTEVHNAHQRQLIPATAIGKNAAGHSQLLEAGLASAPDAEGQIQVPAGVISAAPPTTDPVVASVLANTKAATTLHALAVHRTASSVWNAGTCVIGEPISQGTFEAARVEVLDNGPSDATTNFDKEIVGIAANADGPERDALNEVSLTQLYDGAGSGFGLMAATMTTIAPVTLFEGTANETTIEVLGPAVLRAMADGTSGGAKVEFLAPAVSIIQNGERNVILPTDATRVIQLPVNDGGVLEIRIGQLDVSSKAANGTSATAKGAVVTAEVLGGAPAPAGFRGATIALGHVEASVSVPVDGISCALRVSVDAYPNSVGAGKTVEVTSTVFNEFDCPLQAVSLVDTLTVGDDATFTIMSAPGSIRKTPGTNLTRGEIDWLIPSIPAHGSAQRSFTLRMDTGSGKVNISGIAAGKLANCNVIPGADDTNVSGLGSGRANVGGTGIVRVPVSRVLGGGVTPGENLPTTGVASAAAAGIALLTSAGGLAAMLRRRDGN